MAHHNSLFLKDITSLPLDLPINVNTFKLSFQSASGFSTKLFFFPEVIEYLKLSVYLLRHLSFLFLIYLLLCKTAY